MTMDLNNIKEDFECRTVESGIWTYIHEDTKNYTNLLKEHAKLESYISELYREITLIGKDHELFEHINSYNGKKLTELLGILKIKLVSQYEALIKIKDLVQGYKLDKFSERDIIQIRSILDGEKNGQNQSETSQKIIQIEKETESLLNSFYNLTVQGLPKPENIENPIRDFDGYFNDKAKYLTPVQYFEIIRLAKDNPSSPYRKIYEIFLSSPIERNKKEWLNMAVMLKDGVLHIALNPKIRLLKDRNGIDSPYEFYGTETISIPAPNFIAGGWNRDVSKFSRYFGIGCSGIFINNKNEWYPVSTIPDYDYIFYSTV